jgi:hypothetical protein
VPIDVAGDVRNILRDAAGFACTIQITDPYDKAGEVPGFARNIGAKVDVETGLVVSAREANVTISIAELRAAGFTDHLPAKIADGRHKPWRVSFTDAEGADCAFVVIDSRPNLTAGYVTCILGAYVGS